MINDPRSPELVAWGATYTPAEPRSGHDWWEIVQADGPFTSDGKHAIYVDVWDEQGNRLVGIPVTCWNGGRKTKATEPKPGEPAAVDFPMFGGGHAYGVRVDDGSPSDVIFGFGLPNFMPHHWFRVIFRRRAGVIVPEPPVEPPEGTDAIRAQFEVVRAEVEKLGRML